MKALMVSLISLSALCVYAKELRPYEDSYTPPVWQTEKGQQYDGDLKVSYLTRLLDHQQRAYEDKIAYLEQELKKSKDRLIEKSMNQEKLEKALEQKYAEEALGYKKALASTTKTMLDYQRQLEKMRPSEDLKNMIKLNTELASELRRSEDQIAIIQLKGIEANPGIYAPKGGGSRLPASVQEK